MRTVPVVLLLVLDGRENQHAHGMYNVGKYMCLGKIKICQC